MKQNNTVAIGVKSVAKPKKHSSDKSVDNSPGKDAKRAAKGCHREHVRLTPGEPTLTG